MTKLQFPLVKLTSCIFLHKTKKIQRRRKRVISGPGFAVNFNPSNLSFLCRSITFIICASACSPCLSPKLGRAQGNGKNGCAQQSCRVPSRQRGALRPGTPHGPGPSGAKGLPRQRRRPRPTPNALLRAARRSPAPRPALTPRCPGPETPPPLPLPFLSAGQGESHFSLLNNLVRGLSLPWPLSTTLPLHAAINYGGTNEGDGRREAPPSTETVPEATAGPPRTVTGLRQPRASPGRCCPHPTDRALESPAESKTPQHIIASGSAAPKRPFWRASAVPHGQHGASGLTGAAFGYSDIDRGVRNLPTCRYFPCPVTDDCRDAGLMLLLAAH